MQISGWLSDFNKRSSGGPLSSLGIGKSLQSLRVLNLRYHTSKVMSYMQNYYSLGSIHGSCGILEIVNCTPGFVPSLLRGYELPQINADNVVVSSK